MRKLLSLLTALLFVGSMWGETYTLGWGTASGTAGTYSNFTAVTGTVDGIVSFSTDKNSSATPPAYNKNNSELRLYFHSEGDGGSVTLTPASGVTITGFVMTTSTTPSVNYFVDGGAATSVSQTSNTYTVSGISATSSLKIQNVNTTNTQLRIKTIAITYTTSGGDVIVKTLKSIAVAGMTTTYDKDDIFSFDGTCTATYSVTKNDEPQDDEEKTVTPTSVSSPDMTTIGEKTVTVSFTDGVITKTADYSITVQEHVITPGSYDIALSNTFFGCSTGNIAQEQSAKKNDVTFVAGCKSGATSKTYYDAGHVRFYADSYLHISVPEGYVIDTIIFTAGGTWNGGISANVGTYVADDKKWTGSAKEVDFSFTAQDRISSVHVHYDIAKPALILSTNALDFGSVVKDASVAAQTFTLSGENLEDAHAVTLVAPSGFTVSPTSITPSSGSISAQTITVTPITSAVGAFDGNLTISSDDLDADSIVALSLTVTAAEVNVTSVELDKTSISIEEGETETLIATVLPVDATNKAVTWESSDEDIATVADGIVTAVAKGSATITCKSVADPTKLATCEVTVTGPDVVLDFTTNEGWSFPTSKTTDEDTFTNGDYSVTAGGGYYFVSDDHCLLVGKQNAYLTLPIFTDKAISKIITLAESTGSKDVVFNIYQGATEVSTEVTSCKVDQTFNISPKKVNTEHTLKIKSAHNARFSKILIYYGEPDPIYAVNCAAAENGSVSADKASACAGETVTLTLTPDAGYKVASVAVNGGDPLAVTENQATFEMPAAIANVVATFSVATALDNTEVDAKAVKVLRNGILLIEKNGHTYNAMGQLVK